MKASGGISLVDANVWLALVMGTHLHNAVATAWFDAQPDRSCAFCRVTQMALLRHLTNLKIMGVADVLSQKDAWQSYETFVTDTRVIYMDEPSGIELSFRQLTSGSFPAHKQWTDRYLAAFADCLPAEIVTFDAGFKVAPGRQVRLLTASP